MFIYPKSHLISVQTDPHFEGEISESYVLASKPQMCFKVTRRKTTSDGVKPEEAKDPGEKKGIMTRSAVAKGGTPLKQLGVGLVRRKGNIKAPPL